jgi:mono/diheme cytochrome c family protein
MKIKHSIQGGILMLFLAFIISCSDDDTVDQGALDQQAYDAADRVNGGRLYDKFWAAETDFESPSDASVSMTDITDFGDFYRCKQCHAWDQKARFASYIDRGPSTTRPDVSAVILTGVKTDAIRTLFEEIKQTGGAAVDPIRTADGTNPALGGNDMPDYGKILTDDQIWDLVKFLREGAFDTDQLYDVNVTGTYPTGSRTFSNVGKDGDAAAGTIFYNANCATCHGTNGRDDGNGAIITINADIGRSMGEFAREKTYEMQHKSVYGNLGSSMGGTNDATLTDIKNMLKALSDPIKYPDLK